MSFYEQTLVSMEPLTEAVPLDSGFGGFVDPMERFFDGGERWQPIGVGYGEDMPGCGSFSSEQELADARQLCRWLDRKSPYVKNAHTNRVNYIVGYGHTYKIVAKDGQEAGEETIRAVQETLDEWQEENRWGLRQQEIVKRCDRDGEAFLRFFEDNESLRLRFVEPGMVKTPDALQTDPAATFGIRTEPDDVETVLGYYIGGQLVDAAEIQHRKANVDSNVKRGEPLCWAAAELLRDVRKVRRNIVAGSNIQTSIAYVKTVEAGGAAASAVRGTAADAYRTNTFTGKQDFFEQQRPGKIITAAAGIKYEAPFATVNYSTYVEVIAAQLREFAAMLVMPEFMLTSDASNGNYASTMVAEGPAVRQFERLQYAMRDYDKEVMARVLDWAVRTGKLSQEQVDSIEVQAECPPLGVRDRLQDAQVSQIQMNGGLLSPQTASAQAGLDYDQEQKNRQVHNEQNPDDALPPLATARDPNQDRANDPSSPEYQGAT